MSAYVNVQLLKIELATTCNVFVGDLKLISRISLHMHRRAAATMSQATKNNSAALPHAELYTQVVAQIRTVAIVVGFLTYILLFLLFFV